MTDIIIQISDLLKLYYETKDNSYINQIMDLCIKHRQHIDIGYALSAIPDKPDVEKAEKKLENLCKIRQNVLKQLVEKKKQKDANFKSYLT